MSSPYLNHFIQPDSLIPDPSNPQAWNRYSYVGNNPIRFNDPTGHMMDDGCRDYGCGDGGGGGTPTTPSTGGGGGNNDDEDLEDELQQDSCTYHLCSDDSNLYELGWQNAGQAWTIYTNPNASYWQRYGAGAYMGAWGGMHVAGAVGAIILAWEALVPGSMSCIGNPGCEETFTRYISAGELDAINKTGLLRGGNPGATFFTKDVYISASQAQQQLSLITKPQFAVEFQIVNSPQISGPTVVEAIPNLMSGGGSEFWSYGSIQVILNSIQELIP